MNRIPKPAKNPKKCSLKLLGTDGKVPTLNLFRNKRCKGWWPVAAREKDEETGEERLVLKVSAAGSVSNSNTGINISVLGLFKFP